jgi:hypothetical protein
MEDGSFRTQTFHHQFASSSHTFVMTAMIMTACARMMMITLISASHISCKRNYYRTYQNSYQLQNQQHTGTAVRSRRGTPF